MSKRIQWYELEQVGARTDSRFSYGAFIAVAGSLLGVFGSSIPDLHLYVYTVGCGWLLIVIGLYFIYRSDTPVYRLKSVKVKEQ